MVRRWGLGAIALVAACKFTPPQDLPSDARLVDGPAPGDSNLIDAPVVPPDAPFVCSASTLACSSGIALTHTCGGHCWVSCTAAGDQPTAAAACTNWGGKLAPIETQTDQDCVRGMIFPAQASWIGFEQDASATTLLGNWSWNSDGQVPGITKWSSGQPNDGDGTENGAEQCAYMSTSANWQDTPCTTVMFNFSCRH